MATINKTRLAGANAKATHSSNTVTLKPADFAGVAVGDTMQLFTIPENSMITSAWIVVKSASQASVTAGIGITANGTELGASRALSSVAVVGATLGTMLDSGTGKVVYFTPSAIPTQGEFDVIVNYIEYRLGNGNLTALVG